MTSLLNHVNEFIKDHQLITTGDTIIIGLSGGPDSVFLTHALKTLQEKYDLKLIAAHLNHEWRVEAATDAQLCAQLCKQLDIPLISITKTELNFKPKHDPGSQEARGRMMRRYFFEQVRQQYNAQSIALAHHRQDQEETFFIRLIRGTTLDGLTSMKPRDGYYIRPLLNINKHQILEYLHKHNIAFATDVTNVSQSHLRNRIRAHVIPALQACDTRFDDNFERTLEHLQQANDFIKRTTAHALFHCLEKKDATQQLKLTHFFAADPFLQPRMLIEWLRIHQVPFILTQAFIAEILKFLASEHGGTHTMHHTWKIVKSKGLAHIEKEII